MIAWLNLRYQSDKFDIYAAGFEKLGYEVKAGIPVRPEGVFLTWNRIGTADAMAKEFTKRGLPVLVAENGTWGKSFQGRGWYTIARTYHNTAGMFPIGSDDRWDSLGVEPKPWRKVEGETVILAQRGIGSPPTVMPYGWAKSQKGRLRKHPGRNQNVVPLEEDLANASKVVTWGSGAAIKALILGIPVESHMPNWIGAQDNTDEGRLAMLRRLAWAQWEPSEIESGAAFARLLG